MARLITAVPGTRTLITPDWELHAERIEQPGSPLRDDDAFGVSREPRGVRCTKVTPVCASIARTRAEAACWLTPACLAALFRLLVLATLSSNSSAARSGTCGLSAIRPPPPSKNYVATSASVSGSMPASLAARSALR